MQKICKKCNELKDINSFSKQNTNKDEYKNTCKLCVNEYGKNYRNKNITKERERSNNYYICNKSKRLAYFEKNKDNKNKYATEYRKKNKDKISEKQKKNYLKNKEIIKKKNYEYYKMKMVTDSIFKLKKQLRGLIRDSLKSKGIKKQNKTIEILGCTIEEFKQHLESKFEPWMNWDNKGLYNGELNYGWDIDHITPSSSGLSYDEIIKLNHYTNLQPLCGKINRVIKRNNI